MLIYRHLGRWICVLMCLLTFATRDALAQTKEYQVKAAFLYNFAQFVEWPSTALTNSEAPFRIGILGDNPFGMAVDKTVEGESVKKHKMEVIRARQLKDLQDCQLIFICKSEQGRLDEILTGIDSNSILTVGDSDGFAQKGGVVNFYLEGTKVRFEVNPDAAKRAGLKISSQMLSLGKIVKPGKAGR